MVQEFGLVVLVAIFGVIAALPMIIIPTLFSPKKSTPLKLSTFEAGQAPAGESRVHLMMQYYSYLIMFVVVDVTVMFLFAWGAAFQGMGLASAPVIFMFLIIIFIPIAYALRLAGRRELW